MTLSEFRKAGETVEETLISCTSGPEMAMSIIVTIAVSLADMQEMSRSEFVAMVENCHRVISQRNEEGLH